MKIGVISDTHGSLKGWRKAWKVLKEADEIIHCGDIIKPGGWSVSAEFLNSEKFIRELNGLEKNFFPVMGNCDSSEDLELLSFPLACPCLVYRASGIKIIASHGHLFHKDEDWWNISKIWKTDILITGHTHRWKIENHKEFFWINPGSPSFPKEEASSALIDTCTGEIQVFNLDTLEVLKKTKMI